MENRENTAVAPRQRWTDEQIHAIRNTVAEGATNSELEMFLSLASKYELDPFAKEIWFVKTKTGKNIIMTGRDGYLKIANRNTNFDGMDSDVVRAGDKFCKEGDNIRHIYGGSNRGAIIGAYAVVYRKDRTHPAYVFAPFSEYCKNGGVWAQYPSAMILKVAESMALKRAFSISGLVTEEEVGYQVQSKTSQTNRPLPTSDPAEEAKVELWQRFFKTFNGDKDKAIAKMKEIVGNKPSREWEEAEFAKLNGWLKANEAKNQENTTDTEQEEIHKVEVVTEQEEQEEQTEVEA